MAAPSQVLPPWLTPTPVLVTDPAGVVSTETTVVYVPPTYFGPSIPLGTLYSFGGSTFPPTIQLPGSPTATPSDTTTSSPTSSALPTSTTSDVTTTSSSTTSSTTSATTTSTTSITTSSTTSSTLPPTMTSTSTSTPTATPTGALTSLSKGQLVGVIVASILGLIFLFVLALFLFLWCKGRRNRRSNHPLRTIDEDYYIVTPEHTPGDGSPRHSGEEADPFLVPHTGSVSGSPTPAPVMTQVDEHGTRPYPYPATRVPPPLAGSTSTTSSNSNASGYGVILDRPSLGFMPEVTEEDRHHSGTPLSPEQMRRLEQENVIPDDDAYSEEYTGAYAYSIDPLVPPPRLVDPEKKMGPDILPEPFPLSKKPSDDGDEAATLLTARRVRVETLGPRNPPQLAEPPAAGPSRRSSNGLLNAIGLGLGSLVNLGRKSWFKSNSPHNSVSSYEQVFDAEKDLEPGLLAPSQGVDSLGHRVGRVGLGPDGSRPKSGVSARSAASGQTLYHDAASSLPGTPSLTPLPPARTSPDSTPPRMPQPQLPMGEPQAWLSSPLAGPPMYDDNLIDLNSTSPSPRTRTRSPGSVGYTVLPSESDILDAPAPSALNHFSSLNSLRDTATSSPAGGSSVTPLFPPGLESTIRPVGWGSSGVAGVETSLAQASAPMGLGMDILDQVPPDAEHGWKVMASTHQAPAGYRGSFGTYMHSPGFASEQGSLHSMRSVYDPPSMRSAGSAPAAQFYNNPYHYPIAPSPYGSASSRPSHRSVAMSMANSLARTGSIPSMNRSHPSPAMSAFGPQVRRGSPAVGSAPHTPSSGSHFHTHSRQGSDHLAYLPPTIESPYQHLPPPPRAALTDKSLSASLASATTLVDHQAEEVGNDSRGTVRCRPTNNPFLQPARSPSPSNASLAMSIPPWAGGLDSDWSPAL